MNVNEMFPQLRISRMPAGGNPQTDAAFEAWANKFTAEENLEFLDRETAFGGDLPDRELFTFPELLEHLYGTFGLSRAFSEADLNYSHRMRYLGVEFARREYAMRMCARKFAATRQQERSQYQR